MFCKVVSRLLMRVYDAEGSKEGHVVRPRKYQQCGIQKGHTCETVTNSALSRNRKKSGAKLPDYVVLSLFSDSHVLVLHNALFTMVAAIVAACVWASRVCRLTQAMAGNHPPPFNITISVTEPLFAGHCRTLPHLWCAVWCGQVSRARRRQP